MLDYVIIISYIIIPFSVVFYLRFWPPPSLVACSQCSSRCCLGTSGHCWGRRRRSRVAWGCMCRSSKRLPAPQQRLCGGLLSAAPGQSQIPPQRDFCPASFFAVADRWARETLCRKDMSKAEIKNRLQNMPNITLCWHGDWKFLTLIVVTVLHFYQPW